MKWLLIVVGVLVGLVAVAWIIGSLIPREHVATRAARFKQPPEKIWEAITNVEGMTSWRRDLKGIERLPGQDGRPAWAETTSFGKMPLEVTEWEPPRRMVTRITDPELPFGGTWTYEVSAADDGATLRLTEKGHIKPALFRFMARTIFGYTSTMEQYLKSLGAHFGEQVTPFE